MNENERKKERNKKKRRGEKRGRADQSYREAHWAYNLK
jgi:hypothetical protein